jgi:hypothetical protein
MSKFLNDEEKIGDAPHVFIQWKGTDACLDFQCECGAGGHFDGDFAYTLKCGECGQVWEMPQILLIKKVDNKTHPHWAENPKSVDMDKDEE